MKVQKARLLRQNQTAAEAILWEQLRNRRLANYKFRRQYPVEHYIVDFICMSEQLIVELDGYHHADSEQRAYDDVRTQFLEAAGYRLVRFWNDQVSDELPVVLETVRQALKAPRPQGEGLG